MKGVIILGTITATGALVIIIGWFTLIQFDQLNETKRNYVLSQIKQNPKYIILIAMMPIGILVNIIGTVFRLPVVIIIGTTIVIIQGLIIAIIFMKKQRWKGMFLLVVVLVLSLFIYIPLFI